MVTVVSFPIATVKDPYLLATVVDVVHALFLLSDLCCRRNLSPSDRYGTRPVSIGSQPVDNPSRLQKRDAFCRENPHKDEHLEDAHG